MKSVSRISVPSIAPSTDIQSLLDAGKAMMGFLPNDALLMAHCPEMLTATTDLVMSILVKGNVDPGLKRLLGYITSQADGCQYCSAHSSNGALHQGISIEKINAVWSFQDSDLFTDKEKAALQIAHQSAMRPNQASDEDFRNLKQHFSDQEIVEIVFTLSLYSFLNKFNHTLKTTVEEQPMSTYKNITHEHTS